MTDRNSQRALAMLPLGAKVRVTIATVPPFPTHIRSMVDVTMRQHAQDAWVTASKLRSVLELWMWFRCLHELGLSIDDASERKVVKRFPSLKKLASFLDTAATFKSEESGGHELLSYPIGDWLDLYGAFKGLITSMAKALCMIGVNSSMFSQANHVHEMASQIMQGNFDVSVLKFEYGKRGLIAATKTISSVANLLDLLKTAPATALKAPKTTDKNDQFKHSPDFVSVVWAGVPYTFSRGFQAACIRLLWKAWEDGTPILAEKDIGIEIEAENENFQLAKVFRQKKQGGGYQYHPAWRVMIQKAGKGIFQLVAK